MSDRPPQPPEPEPYEVLNEPARAPGQPDMPTDVRRMLVPLPATSRSAPAAQASTDCNDVQALLRESTERSARAGAFTVAPKARRPSRRNRDYWLVTIAMNLLLLFAAFGPFGGGMSMIFALAGVIIFNLMFTWTMFFVLDDY